MDFNFDFLAEETLRLSQNTQKNKDFKFSDRVDPVTESADEQDELDQLEEEQLIDRLFALAAEREGRKNSGHSFSGAQRFPSRSGVFYRLDKGGNTFCLRGLAVENLKEAADKLEKLDGPLIKRLRIDREDGAENLLSQVRFFETENLAMAEVICDQLFSRRFPLDEEVLCNLADPGFSWWFNDLSDGFEIYFKSQGLERSERFNCLGPMGDLHLAQKRFLELGKWLLKDHPTTEFRVDSRCLKLRFANSDNQKGEYLRQLFSDGEMYLSLDQFPQNKTMYFYLRELAAIRLFWKNLQTELNDQA